MYFRITPCQVMISQSDESSFQATKKIRLSLNCFLKLLSNKGTYFLANPAQTGIFQSHLKYSYECSYYNLFDPTMSFKTSI